MFKNEKIIRSIVTNNNKNFYSLKLETVNITDDLKKILEYLSKNELKTEFGYFDSLSEIKEVDKGKITFIFSDMNSKNSFNSIENGLSGLGYKKDDFELEISSGIFFNQESPLRRIAIKESDRSQDGQVAILNCTWWQTIIEKFKDLISPKSTRSLMERLGNTIGQRIGRMIFHLCWGNHLIHFDKNQRMNEMLRRFANAYSADGFGKMIIEPITKDEIVNLFEDDDIEKFNLIFRIKIFNSWYSYEDIGNYYISALIKAVFKNIFGYDFIYKEVICHKDNFSYYTEFIFLGNVGDYTRPDSSDNIRPCGQINNGKECQIRNECIYNERIL